MQDSPDTKSFTWREPKPVNFLIRRLRVCFNDDCYTYHQLLSPVLAAFPTSGFIYLANYFPVDPTRVNQAPAAANFMGVLMALEGNTQKLSLQKS